jgi:hydroxyacylglutathione hydrolase
MPDKIQPTSKVSDNFYILNHRFVSSYLIKTGDSLIAFDAGQNTKQVLSEMAKLNLDPAKVQAVFFTHSDPDHTGGIKTFPNAKPYFSKAEVAMFDHSTARFFGMVYAKPPRFVYETVEDGQELFVGDVTVKCVSTPGHTSGSMSFLVNGAILIVGDELNLKKGKAVLDMKFIGIDNNKRLESIHKLAKLSGVKLICPAHSGYSDDFQTVMKEWREEGTNNL